MLKKILVSDLKNLPGALESGAVLDVREPVEFQSEKLKGSKNIPLSALGKKTIDVSKDQPTYLLCRSGNRASQAAEKLESLGYKNVLVIEGGLEECKRQGIAVETGNAKVWALDRQVRFAAGSLVLLGIFLSWILHPALIGLPLFVGAGLVFSGVTDTCGMGMLLAKMPWNKAVFASCSLKKN